MNKINYAVVLLLLSSTVLFSGCVKLWQKTVDIKTYMIKVQHDKPPVKTPIGDLLWIDSVTILPPYNVRSLVLRTSDVEYETSYYTELLLSPSENFRNEFYTWFSASGIFHDVEMTNRKEITHRLVVTVLTFHADMEKGASILKIKVTLLDEKSKEMRVLFSKDYLQKVPFSEYAADELIRAYNQALFQILSTCEKDVIQALN